jgi:hypothetical protein
MTFQVYRAVLGGFWLVSIIACVLAIRWSCLSVRGRFKPAVILSLSALAIACLGIAHFHYKSTTIVNGVLKWRFDSRWLFIVPLVLGAFALVYTLWKQRRSAHVAQDAAPGSRLPAQLPTSPKIQSPDSQRTSSSGGGG